MDMKMITVWFSREGLGGLIVAAAIAVVLPGAPAQAQQQLNANASINFGANGPQAVLNLPAAPQGNVDPGFALIQNSTGVPSNGDTGVVGRTSYKTGEAPEDAGMSGLSTGITAQQYPIAGPGSNFGPTMGGAVNGLMAPNSVNMAGIPLYDGMSYGFNTNPQVQTYSMATGTQRLLNNLINQYGGGFIHAGGPVLPFTSTGSVNIDTTPNNGK